MDIISNQAINPTSVGKSALELVRLFKALTLVLIVQMATFRNAFKTFLKTDLHLTLKLR